MASVTAITILPSFVSPEEHAHIVGATPGSFNDIPAVLRHKEENVKVAFTPPLEGFSADDGENGMLYVIESVLAFMSSTGRGFQISYPTITLHAISRAEGLGPSIYCQLDEGENEASEDADVTGMRELTITPRLPDSLEPMFEALSLCASLHPDPCMSEDGDDDDAFLSADHFEPFAGGEEEELSEVGRAALEHLESIIYDPFQRSNDINGDSEEQERDYREDEARS